MLKTQVGSLLKKVRKTAGLTQADLAARAGVALRIIVDIEQGEANPTVETLGSLAGALKVPVSAFFGPLTASARRKETENPAPDTGRRIMQHGLPPTPMAHDALESLIETLTKLANLSPDQQTLAYAVIENDPNYLLDVSAELRATWRQAIDQSLHYEHSVERETKKTPKKK